MRLYKAFYDHVESVYRVGSQVKFNKEKDVSRHIIVGVHVTERVQHAGEVQTILSKYGCSIRTRLGLHEADQGVCSPNGLIVLEMLDDEVVTVEMIVELESIEGVEVKQMVFDHP